MKVQKSVTLTLEIWREFSKKYANVSGQIDILMANDIKNVNKKENLKILEKQLAKKTLDLKSVQEKLQELNQKEIERKESIKKETDLNEYKKEVYAELENLKTKNREKAKEILKYLRNKRSKFSPLLNFSDAITYLTELKKLIQEPPGGMV